jgi:membrane protein implicated in regulation of membrane protease activity
MKLPRLPSLLEAEGRKAWALLALIGGAQVFTLFAAFAAYQVRNSPGLSFWMGLAAHAQVFVVLAALAWLLGVRRTVKISKDGAELEDKA